VATSSSRAFIPAVPKRCAASAIAALSPESTTWLGALWLAITTESPHSPSNRLTCSAGAVTAHIAPSLLAAAWAISAPRARAISSATSSLITPAAHRALTSPKLWPPTETGAIPSERTTDNRLRLCAPMPGCAHSVLVSSAA